MRESPALIVSSSTGIPVPSRDDSIFTLLIVESGSLVVGSGRSTATMLARSQAESKVVEVTATIGSIDRDNFHMAEHIRSMSNFIGQKPSLAEARSQNETKKNPASAGFVEGW